MTEINGIKHNVHEHCGKAVVRVQGDIDKNIYDYFFRHLLAYSHGARQSIVTFFFQRLYEHCTEVEQLPARWDEDADKKMVEILNRLNFNEPRKPRSKKSS